LLDPIHAVAGQSDIEECTSRWEGPNSSNSDKWFGFIFNSNISCRFTYHPFYFKQQNAERALV